MCISLFILIKEYEFISEKFLPQEMDKQGKNLDMTRIKVEQDGKVSYQEKPLVIHFPTMDMNAFYMIQKIQERILKEYEMNRGK